MFGSTGGTTPMPTRLRLENVRVIDRHFFVALAELFLDAEAADRAEIAFDVHAEHLLELAPQMARDEMQRLLGHRAAFDGVERFAVLEAVLQLFDQRAFAGADRAHQVEHLPALLALQRGRVEVARNLRHHLLDAEELVGEEVVDLDRFVFEEALGARVVGVVDLAHARLHDDVVHPRVRQLGQARLLLDLSR